MEVEAKDYKGSEKAGVCVPWKDLRPSPSFQGSRGPDWHKETLLSEARGEEVEVWEVFKAIRCAVRLESTLQNLWHQGIQMRLWYFIFKVISLVQPFSHLKRIDHEIDILCGSATSVCVIDDKVSLSSCNSSSQNSIKTNDDIDKNGMKPLWPFLFIN